MKVSRETEGPVTILRVSESMVHDELESLENEIRECIQSGRLKIVLDLNAVPFIDSAGLEKLQDLFGEIGKHGGSAQAAALSEVCQDVFLSTRIDAVIPVAATTEDAIRSMT